MRDFFHNFICCDLAVLSGCHWDWHNASKDAVDGTALAKWNEKGADTHCSCYARRVFA